MRKAYLDIEMTPSTVHRWGMFDKNPVYPVQLIEPQRLLCFAVRWAGSKTAFFYSPALFSQADDPHRAMVEAAHGILSEADVVVTYYGTRHDIPLLNREFALYGMTPPAPYIHQDLYRTVRSKFKFPFGKLDYVCKELGLGRKVKHEGHGLWIACMRGDAKAWVRMARYNRGDVHLLHDLDEYLKAWEVGRPNLRLGVGNDDACPTCGTKGELVKEGYRYTAQGRYQRYHCRSCGGWSTASRREDGTNIRGIAP